MRLMQAFAAGASEIAKFGPRLWRIARELFHEVMGFIFLAFALVMTFSQGGVIRTFQKFQTDPDAIKELLLVGSFALLFTGFGISSFLRARRVGRGR